MHIHSFSFASVNEALCNVTVNSLFEVCSTSIGVRPTDLIGIYESDNGGKGE